MTMQDRTAEAEGVKRYLHDGGTVLIVGARSSNFPERIRQHPRITVWDTTDPDIWGTKQPPATTRVIICLRFISHSLFGKLKRYATKANALMMPGLNNTGEIKQVVSIALDIAEPEPPPLPKPQNLEISKTHPKPPPMTSREFVRAHGDITHLPSLAEARRLHRLAVEHGYPFSTSALVQQIGALKRLAPPPVKPAPLDIVDDTRPEPEPEPELEERVTTGIGEALRLIDEVVVGLGLVREAVQKVELDGKKTEATISALRRVLDASFPNQPRG
jgi:hypothetical protein